MRGMKYVLDSRQVKPGMGFVALKGERVDGRDYIPAALAAGAAKVIEGLEALQDEAREYRRSLKAKVIGITGSSGKTTTKEFLKTFLHCYGTEGNYNNHIGLPMTILNCPPDEKFLVLEMGTSNPGEIAALCDIAEPDVGLLVSLGSAHIEHFGSCDAIEKEKMTLLSRARDFGLRWDEVPPAPFDCPLPGEHNLSNMSLAYAAARRLGIDESTCRERLAGFSLPGQRWKKFEKCGVQFIDDSYNANPESMKAALDAFMATPCKGRRVAVLGDMLELGECAMERHREIFEYAENLGIDVVIGMGNFSSRCKRSHSFETLEGLKRDFWNIVSPGDLVLLKASHSMRLGDLIG